MHTNPRVDYQGSLAQTSQGFLCDKWNNKESFHQYNMTLIDHLADEDHNYCRQTDDFTEPWCYTTSRVVDFL